MVTWEVDGIDWERSGRKLPSDGRFLSPDPGSGYMYAYVKNSPSCQHLCNLLHIIYTLIESKN